MSRIAFLKKPLIILLLARLGPSTTRLYVFTSQDRVAHVVTGMGAGLVILWVFLGGGLCSRCTNGRKLLSSAFYLPGR